MAFGPIARMTATFFTMAIAMAITAGMLRTTYATGPCYHFPWECPASNGGKIPNKISVWAQTPIYFILAFAEIFGFVTLLEYSYSNAPKDMRSLIQALRQVTASVGSAFGMALSPTVVNSKILYLYTSLAVVIVISGLIVLILFAKYDVLDKELDNLDMIGQAAVNDTACRNAAEAGTGVKTTVERGAEAKKNSATFYRRVPQVCQRGQKLCFDFKQPRGAYQLCTATCLPRYSH